MPRPRGGREKRRIRGQRRDSLLFGSMYAHGRGVPQSETEAAAWYRKAANQNDTPAMNNLAMLLAMSSDPKIRNVKEAVSLGEKAVELEPVQCKLSGHSCHGLLRGRPT